LQTWRALCEFALIKMDVPNKSEGRSGRATVNISRREFLTYSAAAGAALTLPAGWIRSTSGASSQPAFTQSLDGEWRLLSSIVQAGVPLSGKDLSDPNYLPFDSLQPAVVPGTVLTSLVANGDLADPYFGENLASILDASGRKGDKDQTEETTQQVGLSTYTYWFLRRFELSQPPPANGRLFLEFRGLNYTTQAYFNTKSLVAEAKVLQGEFLRRRFDVTESVRLTSPNALAVLVEPSSPPGNPATGLNNPNVQWPSSCQGGDQELGRGVTGRL